MDVEIQEGPPAAEGPSTGAVLDVVRTDGPSEQPPGAPRRARRLRALTVVLVVALVGVAVVANVAEARRDGARRAALAGMPAVVAEPLTDPLRETWRLPGYLTGVTVGGLGLVTWGGDTRAIDLATGAVAWTRDAPSEESCSEVGPVAAALSAGSLTEPLDAAELPAPELLACTPIGGPSATDAGTVAVDVLDAATGAVRHTLVAHGAWVFAYPVESDVLFVLATPEGHARASRWDPLTGELLWETTTMDPVFVPETSASFQEWSTADGLLVVHAQGSAAISLEDGVELAAADVPAPSTSPMEMEQTYELPDGFTATWSYPPSGLGHGQVTGADGALRYVLPAEPWMSPVTDGSAPGVLVVTDDLGTNARGLELATGDEIWRAHVVGRSSVAQVDGLRVVVSAGMAMALDVRDGRTVWTAPTDGSFSSGVTDGELVLLSEPGDAGPDLVARGWADGEERWRTPLPVGTTGLHVVDDHLLGYGLDVVFGLG